MESESPDPLVEQLQDLKERITVLEDRLATTRDNTLQQEDVMKYCSLGVLLFMIVSIVDVNYVILFFLFAMLLFQHEKRGM